jgi:hypothetical protein
VQRLALVAVVVVRRVVPLARVDLGVAATELTTIILAGLVRQTPVAAVVAVDLLAVNRVEPGVRVAPVLSLFE